MTHIIEQYIHIDNKGTKRYYRDKEMKILHRDDGPAVVKGSYRAYYNNGLLHCEDGPAIIYGDGTMEWWLKGELVSEEEHQFRTQKEVVLTMDEIAKHLGIDVSKLKIKK